MPCSYLPPSIMYEQNIGDIVTEKQEPQRLLKELKECFGWLGRKAQWTII